MKKILEVIPCLYRGGTEAYVMNHCRAMDPEEFQFDFFVFTMKEYPYSQEIRARKGKIVGGVIPSLRETFHFMRVFEENLRQNGPYDAIHCHGDIQNALPLLCARRQGVPIRISHSHSTSVCAPGAARKLLFYIRRFLIRRTATHWLACSPEAGAALYGRKFFSAKGRVMRNGIDIRSFLYSGPVDSLSESFRLSKSSLVVGSIAWFNENKNQRFMLEIFREILRYRPDAVLLLGGNDAGYLERVRARAAELDLTDCVRFIGPRDDVPRCLKLIDIYLMPSFYEGLPISLLEAQAAGCLCAASDVISNNADMGLDRVLFLPLSCSAKEWAEQIMEKYSRLRPLQQTEIMRRFRETEFEISASAEELRKIYESEKQ